MTRLLEQALRQVKQLPEAEQDTAAGALLDYVKHMRLTDAQVAEVRRRRADPNRKLLSHEEARDRIAKRIDALINQCPPSDHLGVAHRFERPQC